METRRRSPLRILAPVAIIAFAVALAMIISSASKSSGGGSGQSANAAQKARDLGTSSSTQRRARDRARRARDKLPKSVYIVKSGDTLGSIAQLTGVPVAKIQELNPNLDQFSLVAGQKIKIR
jgi:LysM repeat protein